VMVLTEIIKSYSPDGVRAQQEFFRNRS